MRFTRYIEEKTRRGRKVMKPSDNNWRLAQDARGL